MSLHPQSAPPVPEETARIAQRVFCRGHPYLKLRDEFGPFFQDEAFQALFSPCGQPAEAPGCLALVTLLQFAEGLSDEQAADAVRSRIDWKYLLGLALDDPGFDKSVLSEFRTRLVAGEAGLLLLETLLTAFRERGLVKARGQQRTDCTHVLAAIHRLNRLELVGETVRQVLDTLAVMAPAGLLAHADPAWRERYGRRFSDYRLPAGAKAREALALTIGQDGVRLLTALAAPDAPPALAALPEVAVLRQVWAQQYTPADEPVRWRPDDALPPVPERILSPHDPEARYGKKRDTAWVGYKLHLTETGDPERPRLITAVQTTAALVDDGRVLPTIQAALAARGLLPSRQLVDAGYAAAAHLVASQEQYQIELVGPQPPDTSWQARAGQGFAAGQFQVDGEQQQVTCPGGKQSQRWCEGEENGRAVIHVYFARPDCQACALRADCTRAQQRGRHLTLPTQAGYEALRAARERQGSEAFAAAYAARAGVEGTHSQAVRRCGVRQCRYVGEAKTHLQHVLTAAAIDLVRVGDWLMGRRPAATRVTPFAQLAAVPS